VIRGKERNRENICNLMSSNWTIGY